MTVEFKFSDAPEGTVLLIGAQYRDLPKVWTYTVSKLGGRWYFTGTGKVPQDAGWGAVQRWLKDEGRTIVFIRVAAGWTQLWPIESAPAEAVREDVASDATESCPHDPDGGGSKECHYDSCSSCGGYHCGVMDCRDDGQHE